jgi:hypothetical protein
MAAVLSHPFFPSINNPDAIEWAEAAWRQQPQLVRHYIETMAAELHDALLCHAFTVRMVLPPVVWLDGELVQLPLNAPAPLLGGLWANLRQHPIDEDALDALHTLQAHPHPAVAEAGMLLAYRVAYQMAFKDVPPSPKIIAAHEPFGDDGRLWGRIEAAEARVLELADWQHRLAVAARVFPALLSDVYFIRAQDAVREKYEVQSGFLAARK